MGAKKPVFCLTMLFLYMKHFNHTVFPEYADTYTNICAYGKVGINNKKKYVPHSDVSINRDTLAL